MSSLSLVVGVAVLLRALLPMLGRAVWMTPEWVEKWLDLRRGVRLRERPRHER